MFEIPAVPIQEFVLESDHIDQLLTEFGYDDWLIDISDDIFD